MPVYEYQCTKCKKITERTTSIHDSSESASCEFCGGIAHRIISKSSFHLKGDGWFNKPKKEGGSDVE